jgi:hypothetical protein
VPALAADLVRLQVSAIVANYPPVLLAKAVQRRSRLSSPAPPIR